MTRASNPGPASLAGLRWLVAVGPAPVEAWAVAMGWAQSTAQSHATRLARAGWARACSTTRGGGSLLVATRVGVEVSQVQALAVDGMPRPTTWAHHQACAWTAAWLTARGREVVGTRELLANDWWRGELQWLERDGIRRRGHRPDLAASLRPGGPKLPIEVELAAKSTARLRAILGLHAGWVAAGKTSAVIYVCGTPRVAERVCKEGASLGLEAARKTLRVELLETVRDAAAKYTPHPEI